MARDQVTLNTIDDVVDYLSDSVNQVSYDVSNINLQVDEVQNQVNDMKTNVQSLENEVRLFMQEMKQSVLVNNAKQTIMISQMEYDKKYKHRDEVRRRVVGLLQSVDINAIKKDTMETIGEETIVNNPDYWLAPALVALCYWYTDNKSLAEAALKKALSRSEEKTSFLFCLIHMRAGRTNTAIKWLNKYLALQDPTNMDCKIILLLDALCSGVFNNEVTEVILNQIQLWRLQLNSYSQYENTQISKWENYFKQQEITNLNTDNYVNKYVLEKDTINNVIYYSDFHIRMLNEFKDKLNNMSYENDNHQDKIDKLVNMLIFDYEEEELQLKNDIQKSNTIVNTNGMIDAIDNQYLNSYNRADFYTHLTNICLNDNLFELGIHTKKMAIAMSKDYIIKAYKNICNKSNNLDLIDLNIVIDTWLGTTKNGNNEEKLKESLLEHIKNKTEPELNSKKLFTPDMLISIIVGIILIVLAHKSVFLIISILIILIIFNAYTYYKNYKLRQLKETEIKNKQYNDLDILMCIIAEIVDYYFIYEESNQERNKFIEYLNSLDFHDYIKTYKENNKRNIILGGK